MKIEDKIGKKIVQTKSKLHKKDLKKSNNIDIDKFTKTIEYKTLKYTKADLIQFGEIVREEMEELFGQNIFTDIEKLFNKHYKTK